METILDLIKDYYFTPQKKAFTETYYSTVLYILYASKLSKLTSASIVHKLSAGPSWLC